MFLIKIIVLFSFILAAINPIVWIIMVIVFFAKAKTLKSMISDFDQNGRLSKNRKPVSGFYFARNLNESHQAVPAISKQFTYLGWIRNYLIFGFVGEIAAIVFVNYTVFAG
jgi:hypothetical protein